HVPGNDVVRFAFIALPVFVLAAADGTFHVAEPAFLRYSPQISPSLPKATMECHSVCSCALPALSFQVSLVASEKRHTRVPDAAYLISGSLPKLPIRMTLFTLLTNPSPFAESSSLLQLRFFARFRSAAMTTARFQTCAHVMERF